METTRSQGFESNKADSSGRLCFLKARSREGVWFGRLKEMFLEGPTWRGNVIWASERDPSPKKEDGFHLEWLVTTPEDVGHSSRHRLCSLPFSSLINFH